MFRLRKIPRYSAEALAELGVYVQRGKPVTTAVWGDPDGGYVDLPTRLKEATRAVHAQVEDELGIGKPSLDIRRYSEILGRFYGLYAVFEPAVLDAAAGIIPVDERRKLHLLEQDLGQLQINPRSVRLWPRRPRFKSCGDAVGAMYVMEGATLGGQVIARLLESRLGLRDGHGYSFFRCYGEDTGKMWRDFLGRLRHFSGPETHDTVVASAIWTFKAFRKWLVAEAA